MGKGIIEGKRENLKVVGGEYTYEGDDRRQ